MGHARSASYVRSLESRRTSPSKRGLRIGVALILVLGALCLLGAGVLIFFWGLIPISTFSAVNMPELRGKMREICTEPDQLWPPTSLDWLFPAFSPDGRYYVEVSDARLRSAKVLRMFQADNGELVGSYSHRSLIIYCWAEDSSGIYVSNRNPGEQSMLIPFSIGGGVGPVKKLIAP